jgi:hypothetical protein
MGALIEMELLDERRDWQIDVDGVIVDTAADTEVLQPTMMKDACTPCW